MRPSTKLLQLAKPPHPVDASKAIAVQHFQENIALGSLAKLLTVGSMAPKEVNELFQQLWRDIFSFERQFSRFVPASELSVFNRNAGMKQFITPEFRTLLLAASQMSKNTAGLYNPFILPAVQAAGYVHSRVPGYEHDTVDNHAEKSVVTIERLEIGDTWARIPYGTALDLGGCGKGYLADQLRRELSDTLTGYWFSLGGDIAIAGRDEGDKPWTIAIQSAYDAQTNIGTYTTKKSAGVATSGTTIHHGEKDGKKWHHLIDPRTLQPANTDVLLATVCADSTLEADVLASCAVILGSKEGLDFLKKQRVQAAVIQSQTPEGRADIIHFGNGIIIDTGHA